MYRLCGVVDAPQYLLSQHVLVVVRILMEITPRSKTAIPVLQGVQVARRAEDDRPALIRMKAGVVDRVGGIRGFIDEVCDRHRLVRKEAVDFRVR